MAVESGYLKKQKVSTLAYLKETGERKRFPLDKNHSHFRTILAAAVGKGLVVFLHTDNVTH